MLAHLASSLIRLKNLIQNQVFVILRNQIELPDSQLRISPWLLSIGRGNRMINGILQQGGSTSQSFFLNQPYNLNHMDSLDTKKVAQQIKRQLKLHDTRYLPSGFWFGCSSCYGIPDFMPSTCLKYFIC